MNNAVIYRNSLATVTSTGSLLVHLSHGVRSSGAGHYRARSLAELRRMVDAERDMDPTSGLGAVQGYEHLTRDSRDVIRL